MHDEMLNHFDDCITHLLRLRDQLAAVRRVAPGERHETVLAAIAVAERFALRADQTLSPVRVTSAPAPTPPSATLVLADPARL